MGGEVEAEDGGVKGGKISTEIGFAGQIFQKTSSTGVS